MLKYNSSGDLEWFEMWSGAGTDIGYDVVIDSNDNIYVIGTTTTLGTGGYDILVLKYNSTGDFKLNLLWGGLNDEIGYGGTISADNYLYICGYTTSFNAQSLDIVLLKYSLAGILIWNVSWSKPGIDIGYGVDTDSFNNIYICGKTDSIGNGSYDQLLIKYDSTG